MSTDLVVGAPVGELELVDDQEMLVADCRGLAHGHRNRGGAFELVGANAPHRVMLADGLERQSRAAAGALRVGAARTERALLEHDAGRRDPGNAGDEPRIVQARAQAQQDLRVGMPRRADHLGGRAFLDDLPRIHDGDAVRQIAQQREIMAHIEDGDARLVDDPTQHRRDVRLRRDVEAGGRLVQDQNVRLAAQRDRQRDALLLAAAELERIALERLLRVWNLDELEQLDLAPGEGRTSQSEVPAQRLRKLTSDGQGRVERERRALRDVGDPISPQPPAVGRREAEQIGLAEQGCARDRFVRLAEADRRLGGRRFAAAEFAGEPDDGAGLQRERDVPDREYPVAHVGIADAQTFDLQPARGARGRRDDCAMPPCIFNVPHDLTVGPCR